MGSANTRGFLGFLLGLSFLLGLVGMVGAQQPDSIGTITFQVGDTRLERNGQTTVVVKGQTLQVGDRLLTGPDGHIHARMVDNGFISVRPSGRLHIQAYTYDPGNPDANRIGLLLESGVARTISGKAGEAAHEHYRFNTPVAAIGLRGTDYVVQALPDTTRVTVLKGAVTLSAFGPGCESTTLSPCTGPLVRELAAGSPHAYMEIRAQGGLPIVVPPENNKNAPNTNTPGRPEEIGGLAEHRLIGELSTDVNRSGSSTAVTSTSTPAPDLIEPQPVIASQPPPRPEIAWGRWSRVALPGTPTISSLVADDREAVFTNSLFGLLRPTNSTQFPSSGIIAMNYRQGEAYLQTTQPGAAQALVPASLGNASLQLDFNNRQFATTLSATAQGNTYNLYAQGSIHSQGVLYVNPTRSNMNLAGALSNNAAEAGYLFDVNVAPNQNLVGATRWSR